MVGCTWLMCFLLGASTRKEVKTLTRIIRLSIRLGEWPAITIAHSEPRQPQSSVLVLWTFSHFVLKNSFNYPAVYTNASTFQGTHSRRFSGRSWSSPTNFAVSDLSGVPTLSTFNGPFVRLGLEPSMVGESEKHTWFILWVRCSQFFSCFIKQHFDSAFSCCYFPQPRWITPAVCTNFKPRRIWPCWANGRANGRVSWKMLKRVPWMYYGFDKIWQKLTKDDKICNTMTVGKLRYHRSNIRWGDTFCCCALW